LGDIEEERLLMDAAIRRANELEERLPFDAVYLDHDSVS
jgi:hypothetical protein